MKNKLIVIEGTDGCGKKTQSQLLLKRLQDNGINCVLQSFPNYESGSSMPVKMYLNGDFGQAGCLDAYQANSLYAVDRLLTMHKYKDHILNGGSIVFDRYVQSTMLHQAAFISDEQERDKFLDYVDTFEFGVLKLPRPDMVIFLDVPVEFSKKLADSRGVYKSGSANDIHEKDVHHLENAYNAGKYVANKYGWTVISCVENDQLLSIEQISDKIYNAILKKENE